MVPRRFLSSIACLLAACSRPSAGVPEPSAKSPPAARTGAPDGPASSAAVPAPPGEAWVGFIRSGDFRRAAEELDKKASAAPLDAEARYARARVAMALGDFGNAHVLLGDLERELPVLRAEIERDRALSALEAGPFDDALRYFSAKSDAASLEKAALAEERLGALPQARVFLDRVIALSSRDSDADARRLLVGSHAARARVEKTSHDVKGAASDLRWLAVEAPASDEARGVDAALLEVDPKAKLSVDERLVRSKTLAEAGRLDDAVTDLDRAASDPDAKGREAELLRARGIAYYVSRTDYAKASELLDAAQKLDGSNRAHDAFYAARALSRAGDDRQAIARYQTIAKQFPGTTFGEEAAYQAARLTFLLGDWDPAILAYRAYLAGSKKKRRFDAEARYELALASVAARHPDDAIPLLQNLAANEDDALDRSSLHELEGAALADAGHRESAARKLTEVIHDHPLSFPALASALRLATLGLTSPFFEPRANDDPRAPPLAVVLPEKVALFARIGLVQDAEVELNLHESELVAKYAPRGYEALCEAYGKIGGGPERYRTGRRIVRGETLEHAPTDATRWAWECVYPTPFDDVVRSAEERNSLPSGLLHAVMRQESAFKANAISSANAVGLLQLVPDTAERVARELGIEHDPGALRAPARNVEIGAHYLRRVLDTFGGQLVLAAAAYNAGPRAVSRWLETGESLPLDIWVARIPYSETREYVARVVTNLARYSYLRGGEKAVPTLALEIPKGLRARPDDY